MGSWSLQILIYKSS